jgi:hypothetical protein
VVTAWLANVKPIYSHQPGVYVKYAPPVGRNVVFTRRFDKKALLLQPGNTSFSIAGIDVRRDVANNSYKVTLAAKECPIKGELSFSAEGLEGVKYGDDGKVSFNAERTDYEQHFCAIPRAVVKGAITVDGLPMQIQGYGVVTHYRQHMKPHKVALRWHFMKFHSDTVTLNLDVLVTAQQWNMTRVSHGIFVLDGRLKAVTMENDIRYPFTKRDVDTACDIPTAAEFTWRGKTLQGESFEATIALQPNHLIEKLDILSTLPWAIRLLLKAFVARPWDYQWVDRCAARITIDGTSFLVEGLAHHGVTFVNPE